MRTESGWLSEARRCPSPNFNARPPNTDISLLVIHNISLPPDNYGTNYVLDFFQNKLDCKAHPYFDTLDGLEVSAHFFIDRGGVLTQFVSLDHRAWHAGVSEFKGRPNCNDYSIGLELEGSDQVPYTESQYESLVKLTRKLIDRYPSLGMDRIVGHSDIAPGRKTDPGEAFEWGRYRTAVFSGSL